MPTVGIVVPAWNEEARLGLTLSAIAAFSRAHGLVVGVVVVDDGSTDGTVAVAVNAAPGIGIPLEVLRRPHAGKAAAVRAGMLRASATMDVDYVLMLDADNEISVDHLAAVPWSSTGCPVYIGRRVGVTAPGVGARPPLHRRAMSLGMRSLARVLLGLPYPDTQCGFKLFPRSIVPGLFGQQRSRSWVFDAELLVLAQGSGIPIVEVPVVWAPRGASRVRATAAFGSLAGLLGIAARRAAGRYRPISPPSPGSR